MNFPRWIEHTDTDGLFILFLSVLILLLSGGTLLLVLWLKVLHQAAVTTSTAQKNQIYLVFGKKLENTEIDTEYEGRLDRLLRLPWQTVILLGGKTGHPTLSEAQAALFYLLQHNYPRSNILLEESSRNTLENLRNARNILSHYQTKNILIISNRYHLMRCSVLASSFDISHSLCAAENRMALNFCTFAKCFLEAFHLHWFYTGKYWATLTHNNRMLAKIT